MFLASRKRWLKCIPWIVICFLYSCEYTPWETNYQLVEPVNPQISITFLDSTKVNVLRGRAQVWYRHDHEDLDGQLFAGSRIYLDSIYVANGNGDSIGHFELQTRDYPDGNHTIHIVSYFTSGSGSLADRLHKEFVLATKTYQTYLFNSHISPPTIQRFDSTNGVLRVEWSRYNQIGFEEYILYRNETPVGVVKDVNQTWFEDTTYVGGSSTFRVNLVVGGEEIVSHQSASFIGRITVFTSYSLVSDSAHIRVNWMRNTYDRAFLSYRVYRYHDYYMTTRDTLAEIFDIDQTSHEDVAPYLGDSARYELEVIPRLQSTQSLGSKFSAAPPGKRINFPPDVRLEFVPVMNRTYLVYFGTPECFVKSYSGTPFNFLGSNRLRGVYAGSSGMVNSDISSNGEHFYVVTRSSQGELVHLDPNTLAVLDTVRLANLYPNQAAYPKAISVSNNKRLAALVETNSGYRLVLYDLAAGLVLASTPSLKYYWFNYNFQLSADGNYIINGELLYSVQGDTLIRIMDLQQGPMFTGESNTLIQQTGTKIQEFVLQPAAVLQNEFDVGIPGTICDYDPQTKFVAYSTGARKQLIIIDMSRRKIIKSIPVIGDRFRLQNGILFTAWNYITNYYIKVNF